MIGFYIFVVFKHCRKEKCGNFVNFIILLCYFFQKSLQFWQKSVKLLIITAY